MNILQINNHFYKKGGADTVFLNTVALLEAHGHAVCTLSRKTDKDQTHTGQDFFIQTPELRFATFYNKIKYFRSFFYNKESVRVLQRIIAECKPDVAHIHLLYNGISPSVLPVLKENKIPVVMSVHDYRLICPNYWMLDKNGNICEKCIDKQYFHCALKCCSDTFLNSLMLSLEAYYREEINPLDYVNRFIFPSRFALGKFAQFNPVFAEKAEILGNFSNHISDNISEKGKYFLYAGRLSREKGLPTLLDAVKDLPEIKLKVAGAASSDSQGEEPLAQYFHRKSCASTSSLSGGLGGAIDFTGFKTGKDFDDLIKNATFVIVPSECYENNPMIAIEAMSAGKPVIGSRIGGIAELIEDGKTGFLFEPKNKNDLRKTLKKAHYLSDNEYNTLSENALNFAKMNFQKEDYYQKLMGIYEKVIQ